MSVRFFARLPDSLVLHSGHRAVNFRRAGASHPFQMVGTEQAVRAELAGLTESLDPGLKTSQRYTRLMAHSPGNVLSIHDAMAQHFIQHGGEGVEYFSRALTPRMVLERMLTVGEGAPRTPTGEVDWDHRLEFTQRKVLVSDSAFMSTDNGIDAVLGDGAGENLSTVTVYGTTQELKAMLSKLYSLIGGSSDAAQAEADEAFSAMMASVNTDMQLVQAHPGALPLMDYKIIALQLPTGTPFSSLYMGINGVFIQVDAPDEVLHFNLDVAPGQEEAAKAILLEVFEG